MSPRAFASVAAAAVWFATSAACGASSRVPPAAVFGSPMTHGAARILPASRKITHVVFIVQENRSFNYMFMGFPGALTQNYGYDRHGKKIVLHEQGLSELWDIDHSAAAFFTACDGNAPGQNCKMDGWNQQLTWGGKPPRDFAYAYATRSQVRPYWEMAKSYVLADQMFQSNLDGSFVAHQYIIAAFANRAVDYPSSAWGCAGGRHDAIPTLKNDRSYGRDIPVCFTYPTIGNEADQAGVSWRFYAGDPNGDGGIWSSYQAIKSIFRQADWKQDVISPPAQFLTDIANGQLANITWITPSFSNSDHPGVLDQGPQWVTSLVDAIGTSRFWNTSAIFILWDDWGGWFDPVPPIYADYDGLGFRIPLIIISPYAKKGYVSHVLYETSSVLRFMEAAFGLPTMAASDARANDPASDAFDFTRPPRPFKPFSGALPARHWLNQAPAPNALPRATLHAGD